MKRLIAIFLLAASLFFVFSGQVRAAVELTNPLSYDTIEELIDALIDWLFTLALVIVPMVIVVAGYFFVTAAGRPEKIVLARNMVIYALVGLMIIMISKGTVLLIQQIIGA